MICVTKVHHQVRKINRCETKSNFLKELLNAYSAAWWGCTPQDPSKTEVHHVSSMRFDPRIPWTSWGRRTAPWPIPKKDCGGDGMMIGTLFCDEHVEDQGIFFVRFFVCHSFSRRLGGVLLETLRLKQRVVHRCGQFPWAAAAKFVSCISKSVLSFLFSRAAWAVLNVLRCKETQVVK